MIVTIVISMIITLLILKKILGRLSDRFAKRDESVEESLFESDGFHDHTAVILGIGSLDRMLPEYLKNEGNFILQ